jgi:hypothetical protein
MTSLELTEQLTVLEDIFRGDEELTVWLTEVSDSVNLDNFAHLLESSSEKDAWSRLQSINSQLGKVVATLRERRPGSLLVGLDRWRQALTDVRKRFPDNLGDVIDVVSSHIAETYDNYDKFISTYSVRDLISLSISARRLSQALRVFESTTELTKQSLTNFPYYDKSNSELSLLLGSRSSLRNTLAKLSALQTIYDELCRLLSISTSEHQLRIVKVESGSLLAWVFGEAKVTTLMASLIESGVGYLHRNFTREGKVQAIPKNAEAINSLLDLSKRLESCGIDTSTLNQNIQQSSVIIAKELNRLLLDEPVVRVNGRVHSVGEEWERRFLEQPRTLFLESGDPTGEDSVDGSTDDEGGSNP